MGDVDLASLHTRLQRRGTAEDHPPPTELSKEEREADAALDVELVHVIRDALLKNADGMLDEPHTSKLYKLLRRLGRYRCL